MTTHLALRLPSTPPESRLGFAGSAWKRGARVAPVVYLQERRNDRKDRLEMLVPSRDDVVLASAVPSSPITYEQHGRRRAIRVFGIESLRGRAFKSHRPSHRTPEEMAPSKPPPTADATLVAQEVGDCTSRVASAESPARPASTAGEQSAVSTADHTGWALVRQKRRQLRGLAQLLTEERARTAPLPPASLSAETPRQAPPAPSRSTPVTVPPATLQRPKHRPAPRALRMDVRTAQQKQLQANQREARRVELVAAHRARKERERAARVEHELRAARQAQRKAAEAHKALIAERLTSEELAEAATMAEALQQIRRVSANQLDSATKQAQPGGNLWKLFGGDRIEQLCADVALVDARWLIDLAELGGVLPRCQGVPECAKIRPDGLWRLRFAWDQSECLAVLVLSYPWLDRDHPDRLGEHLRRLAPVLKAALSGCTSPHGTIGVMLDYCCLPQRPRTPAEEEHFSRGLRSMNSWYMHPFVHVLILASALPSGTHGTHYANTRGWESRGYVPNRSRTLD